MSGWARTVEGWAVNLDGSDARRFSLPRLELRSSPRGWQGLWFASDGSRRERPPDVRESLSAAKAAAYALAGLVEPALAAG